MTAGQLARLGVAPGDLVPLLAETSAASVHALAGPVVPDVNRTDAVSRQVTASPPGTGPAGAAASGTTRRPAGAARSAAARFTPSHFGYLTPDGYLYFAERSGDRIRRRAENVSAYDIESAASAHPRAQDCAAVGVASSFESDDDIKLCVVPVPGSVPGETGLDEADLIRHLVRALPHYMVPRYIEVLGELPRSATNKIQWQVLRASGRAGPGVWDRAAAGLSVRAIASEGER